MSDVSNSKQNETVAAEPRAGATVIKKQAARIPHICESKANLTVNTTDWLAGLHCQSRRRLMLSACRNHPSGGYAVGGF